ncbi:condensin-2 complex subunit D3, putative [Phytophthora infestans T30-4]|uniref:Condensin-2 complex subunit D3, putative n=1 Tax=Phytophthora infestans (strain T30-4) TaxID=403677 RepID=D0MS45_PHYIT|nr:condensin-2 complex subunit D3, putative [Phytophthora infestans T30-4]EEY58314.1 condensin-2 complex subunit D3, putative [Phytophthora infestans T30-4]|eukprot:XP_002909500.1 condensin-2 complex subunit D3, putative [Phytophthora infestans T30-4]
MEKELVRALQPLALGSVPASAISSLFDTGGTAAVREEWADGVTCRQLRALDKVLAKFLRRQAADEQVAHLWSFFASQEAIDAVAPPQDGNENSEAVYRSLFALLQAVVNIRDVYANLSDAEKRSALLKALVAAKVYLAWLQLPGGSAYGLFMSYVYRQVLDTLKKWQQSSDEDSDEDSHEMFQMLTAYGLELMDMLVLFLDGFSLSASKESIVPTIETAIALQTALPPDNEGTASAMTTKTLQILEALVSGTHGEPLQMGRVILHCYIPGVTLQETVAKENRSSLRFHKLSIDVITRIQHIAAKACEQDDAEGTARQENSLMLLGLIQNICLQAPGLADERQRVLSFVFSTAMAGRREIEQEETVRPSEFRDEECVRLARFLTSYSRNAKLKYRQFAVELISRFVVETRFWKVRASELSEELVPYAGVGPLLEVLIDRARDKMSQVRTKAVAGISAMLTLGLSNLANSGDGDQDDQMNGSEAIASSLQSLLYASVIDDDGNKTLEETPLMQRLVDLFRERLVDEKTFVRRAAVHALEALLTAHAGDTVHASSKKDLFDVHSRCTDSSVVVRVQSIKSLSAILLKFPRDEEAQKLWNLGVLPLCVDPETSVQSCALEAAGRVVFDRVLTWFDSRRNKALREALDCVWMQVSHLDGVMARCLQRALRMLIKSDKMDVEKIIKTCVFAIKESVSPYSSGHEEVQEETEDDATRRLLTRYWGFSWIVLEELAHSGNLVEPARGKQQNLSIVVECWNKLQDQALPVEFNDGSKRILRVIAAISTVIDAQDAKSIADGILASLHSFAIPLNVIADGILALNSICKAKAPSQEKSRDISFAWGNKLLELCETNLRKCFESSPDSVEDETTLLQKQLISIGEVALLEFDKDADKSGKAALLPVSSSLKSLVQLFLPPKFAFAISEPVPLPTPVRVCAFVTLGKLCLRDGDLAKQCMTMFIRELRTCEEQDIRSNILLILGDLCIRYTSLVDAYVPTIALSLLDESRLLRRNTLLLFSQLILQDYIKWRESLLRFFLRAAVDEDEELANLARHVLCGPLLQKSPHIFTNKFIEMIFVFNGIQGDKIKLSEPYEQEGTRELALLGNALYPRRAKLYNFLLEHMSDEQKLQVSMKLCSEVLEEVMDGTLALCENPSQITDSCTEAVLKDTFAVLCSPEIKLASSKEGEDEDDGDDAATGENANVASQIAAAKGKLLSKMSKKNFLDNVVPVLIGLKHTLEAKHSPLTRYLLHYIRELFKMYRQEVKDIFMNTDPQMAMEVEYDLRQLDLQQQQQKQQSRRMTHAPEDVQEAPTSPQTASKSPRAPQTPQEELLEASHTPVRLRDHEKVSSEEARRQTSEPSTLIFSPSQGHPTNENWHVTAKSPSVDKPPSRSQKGFTQEDLEGRMKKDLAAAFDSASNSDEDVPPTVNTSRRRTKAKAKAKEKAKKNSKVIEEEQQEDEDEEEEVVPLPLKKKAKKKTKPVKKVQASTNSRPKRKRN